jgi:hypothetical protein
VVRAGTMNHKTDEIAEKSRKCPEGVA